MVKECDVLVVGGGPAGVLASYTAAKLGKSVVMADAKTYEEIGNKTCGDAIDLRAPTFIRDKIGIALPHGKEVSDLVECLVIQTENRELPIKGEGFVLNRHIYGQRLLKEAKSAGVEILEKMRALKGIFSNGYVEGAVFKNLDTKEEETIKANITIDCSGRNFIIRKTMPKSDFSKLELSHTPNEIVASFREIIKLKEDHSYHKRIYLMYDKDVPEPGYFWFFSKGPYQLNAGIGWKLSRQGKGANMRKIYKLVLHKYYPPGSYEVIDAAGYTIPARYPLLNQVANGFITAGDAAFHVDPFTAEGHGPALMAGYFAGKQASEAIEAGNLSEKQLWGYNNNVFETFGTMHCKAQILSEVLQAMKISGMDMLFGRNIMTTEEFGQINQGMKLSFMSKLWKAIKITPRYDYLLKLNKLANGASKVTKAFESYPTTPEDYNQWYKEFYPWYDKLIHSFGNY